MIVEIDANVQVICGDCGQVMHRVPQLFSWGRNPGQVLLEYMDDQYRDAKARSLQRRSLNNAN